MSGKHDKSGADEQAANLLLTGPIVIRGLTRGVKDALRPGQPSRHRAFLAEGAAENGEGAVLSRDDVQPTPVEAMLASGPSVQETGPFSELSDAPAPQEQTERDSTFPPGDAVAHTGRDDGPGEDRVDDRRADDAPPADAERSPNDDQQDQHGRAATAADEAVRVGDWYAEASVERPEGEADLQLDGAEASPGDDEPGEDDIAQEEPTATAGQPAVAVGEPSHDHGEQAGVEARPAGRSLQPMSDVVDDFAIEGADEVLGEHVQPGAVDEDPVDSASDSNPAQADGDAAFDGSTSDEGDEVGASVAMTGDDAIEQSAEPSTSLGPPDLDRIEDAGAEPQVDSSDAEAAASDAAPDPRAESQPAEAARSAAADATHQTVAESAEPPDELLFEELPLDQPIQDLRAEGGAIEDVAIEDGPVGDGPAQHGPTGHAPTPDGAPEDSSGEDLPVADVPVDDLPADHAVAGDRSVDDVPVEDVPDDDLPPTGAPPADVATENDPRDGADADEQRPDVGHQPSDTEAPEDGPTAQDFALAEHRIELAGAVESDPDAIAEPTPEHGFDEHNTEEHDIDEHPTEKPEQPRLAGDGEESAPSEDTDRAQAGEPDASTAERRTAAAADQSDQSDRSAETSEATLGGPASALESRSESAPADGDASESQDAEVAQDPEGFAAVEAPERSNAERVEEPIEVVGVDFVETAIGAAPLDPESAAEKDASVEDLPADQAKPDNASVDKAITVHEQPDREPPDGPPTDQEQPEEAPAEARIVSAAAHGGSVDDGAVRVDESTGLPLSDAAGAAVAVPAAAATRAARPTAPRPDQSGRPPRRPRLVRERFGREAIGIALLVVLALVCGGLITAVILKTQRDAAIASREVANYAPPPLATPEPSATGPLVAVIGDGTTSGAASGVSNAQKWSGLLGSALSGTVTTDASDGMGYAAKGGSGETFVQAAAKVPANADAVVFFGGTADANVPALSLAKAATDAYAAAKKQAPNAKIIVVGPPIVGGASTFELTAIRNSLRSSAAIAKATWLDPIDANWLTSAQQGAASPNVLTAAEEKTIASKMQAAIKAAVG